VKPLLKALCLSIPLIAAPMAAPAQQVVNLQNADIRAFIQDVAKVTGRTFIVDPRVQGTVTVASDRPMSRDELLEVLLSTLRANGLVAIPTGANAYRIVPDEGAAQQPGSVGRAAGFATEVFRLQSIDAATAAEVLKPLVGRQGVVIASPQGNSLVVADYADNLRRLRGLIARIDQDQGAMEIVSLRNGSAREIIGVINQLMGGQGGRTPRLAIAPVESSNAIVLRGDPAMVRQVKALIADLDQRAASTDDVRVIRLQHASAEKLLPVLQQLVGQALTPAANANGPTPAPISATPVAAPGAANAARRSANIARFDGANALVISADPDTQRVLADVIRQLDSRREQVLVEAIVVEISDGVAQQLGVQFALGGQRGSGVPFFATNFPDTGPSLLGLGAAAAGDQVLDPDSSALQQLRAGALSALAGVNGGLGGFGGQSGDALFGAIIKAVKSDSGSNLLSTPSILTLDNEAASILVGQEIPVTTGEVLGDANSNPFRTIQRQNVGVQLEVKPQINAGGAITLFLRQEVSSVAGPVSAGYNELVLNKRELETTVLVDDGQVVVLGGLLDQNERLNTDKVPVLGDIPGLGALFRSTDKERQKRNLMVFIRPRIVRSQADAQALSAQRYNYVRADEAATYPDRRSELEALVRDYLAANPPSAPTAAPVTTAPLPAPSKAP